MSEWISVEDRRPVLEHEDEENNCMISQTVLVTDSSSRIDIGFGHYTENGEWDIYEGEHEFMYVLNVTHWMPLPEPPKEQP